MSKSANAAKSVRQKSDDIGRNNGADSAANGDESLHQRTEAQAREIAELADELLNARQSLDQALQRADHNTTTMRAILDTLNEGVVSVDEDGAIVRLNPAAEALFGVAAVSAKGQSVSAFVDGGEDGDFDLSVATLAREDLRNVPARVKNAGEENGISVLLSSCRIDSEADASTQFALVLQNIQDRKLADEQIRNLEIYDPLTGLANRQEFMRRLEDAVALSRRSGNLVALLFLDLDRFKQINDTYGHPIGDGLLNEVASLLGDVTREIDTVAHLGGDEFAIVMPEVRGLLEPQKLAERIIESIAEPITVGGTLLKTGTSIGISFYPNDANEIDELIRLADIALYDAKRDGRGTFKAHSEHANAAAAQLSRIETDIKLGIVRNEFEVYYQPIVDAKTRLPSAAEALVRWSHPSKGLVFPGAFISVAEDLGLIVEIGRKVLEQACLDARRWIDEGFPPIRVAVNVSPAQLRAGCLIEDVQKALDQSGFPADHLELEINESLFIEDYENATGILSQLRNEGIQLAIDDFGTRYSSLARLQRLPVQRLKIDQSFVRSLHTDVDSATISNAIITLGKSLDLDIVAEGVEYEDQITFLRDHGCDELQGFLFAKPCPVDQFMTWLKEVQ